MAKGKWDVLFLVVLGIILIFTPIVGDEMVAFGLAFMRAIR